MKLLIAASGKMKEASSEAALLREYTKRLSWKVTVKEFDIKHADTTTRQMKEAESLLGACEGYEKLIALDERGKDLSSRELAKQFSTWQQQGASSVAIIIGGADGLHESVRKKAHLLLAFGRATWPHMLVRAMLAEQLYRVSTILENHPYHRD
jgi:23S rRNA (pseudouridine1915-N3)-methyltransferase